MGKKNSGSSDRASKIAKAGKRSGQTTWPASASPDRLAAKEQGEKQFIAQKQLTAQIDVTKIEYDKALSSFVERTKKVTITTEYEYDANRGRIVYSPSFKEKSSK